MTTVSKTQLVNSINADINNNSNQEISPEDIRHNLIDLIDSVHLLLDSTKDITIQNLTAKNFYTPSNRSVIAGEDAISKLDLDGYVTNDNTAIGYAALKNNYQGSGNTSIGSFSLSCNIFGDNNSAIGVNSLSQNTNGFGNVGFGNYTLTRNKTGDFNVAIGHGAGYYSKNENHKLYIASHAVDEKYICANPLGSGLTPLVYGDMSTIVLGVGTKELNSNSVGVLQTSGNISPTVGSTFDLGYKPNYEWRNLYLSNEICMSDNVKLSKLADDTGIGVSGDIVPHAHKTYDLGSSTNYFASGYITHLFTEVTTTVTNSAFTDKNIILASDGNDPQETFSTLEQIKDGGIILKGSGVGLATGTDFNIAFRPSGESTVPETSFENYTLLSRCFYEFNTSLHTTSDCHIHTPRILNSRDLDLLVYSPDDDREFGLYLNSGALYVTSDSGNIFTPNPASSSGNLAGVGDVNLLSPSGVDKDYFMTVGALESGVTVGQRFIGGVKQRNKDGDNLDKLQGFTVKYIDDSDTLYTGPRTDRFAITSHDDTSYSLNNMLLMKNHSGGGIFGINNFAEAGDTVIPQTALNVRSITSTAARFTAEVNGYVSSAIQLLTNLNCLASGLEIIYHGNSGVANFNMYDASGVVSAITMDSGGRVGVLSSGALQDTFTVGCSLHPDPVISIAETSGNHPGHASRTDYVKLYAKAVLPATSYESSKLEMIDDDGNIVKLSRHPQNHEDNLVLQDSNRNTFAGSHATVDRAHLNTALDNTGFGYGALALNSSGDYNTAFGSHALSGITDGDYNIGLGYKTGNGITTGNYNILIGNNLDTDSSYKFTLGSNASNVLMSGCTGPAIADRQLNFPNGKLLVQGSNSNIGLGIDSDTIKYIDRTSSDFPSTAIKFELGGARLSEFSHDAVPMSGFRNTTTAAIYETPDVARPNVSVSGDIKLLGAVRFSDGTSIDSTDTIDLNTASGVAISGVLFDNLQARTTEGFMVTGAGTAASFTSPTSGFMTVYDQNGITTDGVFVVNRDKYSSLTSGDYIVALRVNNEFRPLWISNEDLACNSCCN